MDKIENPYQVMLERLRVLDQSIYVLNQVNKDLRQILHKQKPLPKFIQESFKRATISRSKTVPALPPPPPPAEVEEIRLASSIIDKAKRTIENVGEKKPKQSSTVIPPVPINNSQNQRPKSSSTVRPSSANSTSATLPPPSSDTSSTQVSNVRRFVPAHMKAPFQTQPEKKRRPISSTRNNIKTNPTRRSISQQRRQVSSLSTQSIVQLFQPASVTQTTENVPSIDTNTLSDNVILPDETSAVVTTEESVYVSNEIDEIEVPPIPQPIILNRALIKPLRRLWKQNQSLRSQLSNELEKKPNTTPVFIERLKQQIHSAPMTDEIRIPNIDALLQLAVKLRAIILHLLENSAFDDFEATLKRLHTLKCLVNQYQSLLTPNINILVSNNNRHQIETIDMNVKEWLMQPKSSNTVRYTDDGQLIAFTEVRFKQFENEYRWIELNWHEQMILQFKQSQSNKNLDPLQIYRELMALVTGLQTSTPIVVENRLES